MSAPIREDILVELGDALDAWAKKHLKPDCWYEVRLEIQNSSKHPEVYLSDVYVQQSTGDGADTVLAATG